MVLAGTTTSTSTTTGALVVAGGAGIAGNLNIGGNLVTTGPISGVGAVQMAASLRSNRNINGGTPITVNSSGYIYWANRYIVISNGTGTNFSTNGYFDITCPTSGTITGVGGASNVTATAAGIPLASWHAIYYILPIGSGATSLAANFRVVGYTTTFDVPAEWVLICVNNDDIGNYYFNNGIVLTAGTTSSGYQTTANTAFTTPVRNSNGNLTATAFTGTTVSITGEMTVGGNAYMSSANVGATSNSSRLGWTDNYFYRTNLYNGLYYQGTFLSFNSTLVFIDTTSTLYIRGSIANDYGNQQVLIGSASQLKVANTLASTSTTTGALLVSGGAGVAGNVTAANVFATGVFIGSGSAVSGLFWSANNAAVSTAGGGSTSPGGSTTQIQYNNAGAFAGAASLIYISGSGNVVATAGTVSSSNVTGAVVVSGAGGLGVGGNVYVGNRMGYVWAANSVSAAYTYFNSTTNSIDTVFG